jgi:hypothetical protein
MLLRIQIKYPALLSSREMFSAPKILEKSMAPQVLHSDFGPATFRRLQGILAFDCGGWVFRLLDDGYQSLMAATRAMRDSNDKFDAPSLEVSLGGLILIQQGLRGCNPLACMAANRLGVVSGPRSFRASIAEMVW